jgi:major inositol transporter-like SP family MFS transporter
MIGALLGGKILYIGRKNTILLLNITAALAAS